MSSDVKTDTLFPLSEISVVMRDAETDMLSSLTTICATAMDENEVDNRNKEKLRIIIFIEKDALR